MHSGNRRRGTPRSPAAASYVCWLPRESTTASNPFPHDIPGTTATLSMVTGSTNPHGKFLWIAMRPRDTVCSRAQREGRHRKNKKSNSVDAYFGTKILNEAIDDTLQLRIFLMK